MGVVFKKNGRPTKSEKGTLKNINSYLSSIGEKEKAQYDFIGETVTDGKRLTEIWDSITASSSDNIESRSVKEPVVEPTIPKEKIKEAVKKESSPPDNVDTETGEIITENGQVKEEHSKFATNNQSMESDQEVLDEVAQDELNLDEVPAQFNPLADPKKQREYNKQETIDLGEIEEPDFHSAPPPEEEVVEIEEEKQQIIEEREEEIREEKREETKKKSPFRDLQNESLNDLSEPDKKAAAKQLVTTVLDGYEMLHELGRHFVKYPDEKLKEKIMNKEVDPSMQIQIDEHGTEVGIIEFFQGFNADAEEAIAYDPEFEAKVRPAMERVFAKKGWGMTDEQFLLVAFGKDIAYKTVQIVNLKKTATAFMATFEELQKQKIAAMGNSPQPVQPDSIITPPAQEEEPSHTEPTYEEPEVELEETPDEEPSETDIVPIHG